jgi:hypothetical protein
MQRETFALLLLAFLFNVQSSTGQWTNFRWISSNDIRANLDRLTPLGVDDTTQEALHFCRAKFETHFYPGQFSNRDDTPTCTITGKGRSHVRTTDFEVLYTPPGSVQWTPGNRGIPEYSFAVGTDAGEGRFQHLGRVRHNGREILGRVVRYRCFFKDGNGREQNSRDYEVLTLTYATRRRVTLTYAPS